MIDMVDELTPQQFDHRFREIMVDLESLLVSVQRNFTSNQRINKNDIEPIINAIKEIRTRLPEG